MFELDFMQVKPARGFYKIGLQVTPGKADGRLLGTTDAAVTIKVTTQVIIENVEIGVADKEQSTSPRSTKVQHPQKAATALEADSHQRVLMRFSLRDKSQDALMVAHQTFIRLTHKESGLEIIFVAEADNAKQYKFDLVCYILCSHF
jgi:oligosaccharyltransferase complex subunit delta (ribophorin II)